MALLDHFPPNKGWEIEIIGTDLSTRTLEVAQPGIWPASLAREIPRQYLKKFMLNGVREEAGRMKAGPEIRSMVRFVRLNLTTPPIPCRETLI
jgi:chemotaxis protein methyltransferase CheR